MLMSRVRIAVLGLFALASPAIAQMGFAPAPADPPASRQAMLAQEKAKITPDEADRLRVAATYFARRGITREELSEPRPEVIYGADDRRDTYQLTDPDLLFFQQAAAVVMNGSSLTNNGNGTYTLNASRWTSQGGTLCPDEPFRSQYQIGFCSGFLVGPDIAVTAGHCISSASGQAFVFGFDQKGPGTGAGADPDLIVPAANVYFVTAIINRAQSSGLDHCVVRLDRPVVGRTPLPVRRSGDPALGEPLVMIGHPVVLPKKTDAGGVVKAVNGTGTGGTNWFTANVDAYGGNSGSMVINRTTGVIEGILVRGNPDFVTVGGCVRSNVCADTGCPGWEEISKTAPFASFIPELGITVSPAIGPTHLGPVGGPFTPPSVTYTLNNATSNPANYTVSIVGGGTAPLLLNGGTGPVSGTIPALSNTTVTVSLGAGAASLPAGTYATQVQFTDTTNSLTTFRTHTVEIGTTRFETEPAGGLVASGPAGGPFTQSVNYTLTSSRPTSVTVRVAASQPWITINGGPGPVDFVLPTMGSSAGVTVAIGGNASTLGAGLYTGSVTFTNLSGGTGDTARPVSLEVGRIIYPSTDTPKPLPDLATVVSTITVPDGYCIGDVDVDMNITHTYKGDLTLDLRHPDGTVVRLHNRTGGSAQNIVGRYDDGGNTIVPDGRGVLANLNNMSVAGFCTITIIDTAGADSGTLNSWALRIVPLPTACPPVANPVNVSIPLTGTSSITLAGVSSNPSALVHIINSLPTGATLSDPLGGTITTTPYTLLGHGKVVRFTPASGTIGLRTFTYSCNDGLPSNIAAVTVQVGERSVIHDFPLNSNPGWSTQGQWAFGVPTGGGSHNRDPVSGFTGANVYGYNLSGDYPNNLTPTQYLTTGALNMTGVYLSRLEFRRWLGVESATYDHANIQASNNGTTWVTVWNHTATTAIDENAWSFQSYDLSAIADNQPAVYIRWGMGTTDGSVTYPGWNIDDIRITGIAPSACCVDYNNDQELDFSDIEGFLAALSAQIPGTCAPGADLNGDEEFDFSDIEAFLAKYNLGC